ncbi:MAG: short-subunit dehydrogenase [Paracoccaceae bacterium]|jgi:short-subunit dehydrogenase
MIKHAVITGGASGMGKVFTQRMAAQGIQVSCFDRNQTALDALDGQANIFPVNVDVCDAQTLRAVIAEAVVRSGPVDRLVTCAAIMPTSPLAIQAAEEIQRIMAINYGGTVNAVQAIVADMLQRNAGQIIIFGSTGGKVHVPECGAYCASKAATEAYFDVLVEENRQSAVQLMLVCPALVDTPLLQQAVESSNPQNIQDSIKHKRFASAEWIIDQVESGLRRKTRVLKPGLDAKIMMWIRQYFPALAWKIMHLSNRKAGA